jgi:putative ABC transport system permease protein
MWRRFFRSKRDQDLEDEIETHLAMATKDRIERGEDGGNARHSARSEFGNVALVKEVTRDMWSWTSLERLLQDLRYGLRILRRSPGYAAVAIISLALGIGANTAIFSLINAVMLKSLPVRDPQQLVMIGDPTRISSLSQGSGGRADILSYPFFERFRERNQVFSDVYATGKAEYLDITASDGRLMAKQGDRLRGRFVTGNYFSVLGVSPRLGRTFTASETRVPGSAPVAVIGYGYWERQFSRDPQIAGRSILVNGSPFTIIGVMPRGFLGDIVGSPIDIWFPMSMQAQANPGYDFLKDANANWLLLMGRLKPGISLAQADAATNSLGKQIFRELYASHAPADEYRGLLEQKIPVMAGGKGFSRMRHDFSEPLLMLMGIVGLVLLICCANVANLQLVRAAGRRREINLRLAIGAARGRLLRQLLTESLLMSLAGGVLALIFAVWASGLLLRLVANDGSLLLDTHLDGRVLLFTAAVAMFAGLLFGLVPAWQSTRDDLVANLRESTAGQSRGSSHIFGKLLIVAQVVFSMILLVAAGLFLRSLHNLETADVGYSRDGLLLAEVEFKMAGYRGDDVMGLARRLLETLQQTPGIRQVTVSENGLFSGTDSNSDAPIEGYTPRNDADRSNHSDRVGPDYFQIVGTPVLAGRGITAQDVEHAPSVAVINESLARFYFPHQNPIGRHIFDDPSRKGIVYTIVGIVRDTKQNRVREPPPRRFYLSFFQAKQTDPIDAMNLEIRTQGRSSAFIESVRRAIRNLDPKLPIFSLKTADALIDDTLDQEKLIAKLSTLFGALALVLAAIGLYGVLSYMTVQRTSEIGIRMALGAQRGAVLKMVLSETFLLVLLGLAIGTISSLGVTTLLHKLLFGLSTFAFVSIAMAALAIVFASVLATWLPAWRASRVDPTVALRYE